MTANEKISVLLHEYNTLRAEIINKGNHLYQLFALCGILFIWIVGHPVDRRFWISIFASLTLLLVGWWFIYRDVEKAAERLREIEKMINDLADEDLLVWETRWGGAVTGYWGRARPLSPAPRTTEDGASTHT